ncbi:Phenolic glucoside malonyltransferase [Quillaja saponaria]|uniref:Phenolic glucoside malonyltransferase n=1 Tax=Quillaja saponaria TaxID=32244 RepID=A0AAD7VG08_QUISA|nr:Phenolic glucoside malonyltransferase [Quillaja saponaria]
MWTAEGRLDPPIPAMYFGNCIKGQAAMAETKGLLGKDGLFVAVEAISKALRSLEEDGVVHDVAETRMSKVSSSPQTNRVISTAGSPRFGIYEVDFGWGKPRRWS